MRLGIVSIVKNTLWLSVAALLALCISMVVSSTSVSAASMTWTGAGSDSNFSTANNWSTSSVPQDGDDIIFNASDISSTAAINDINGLSLNSVTIQGTGTARIDLSVETIITDSVMNEEDVVLVLGGGFTLGADVTVDGGDIQLNTLSGAHNEITLGGHTLRVQDAGAVEINVPITGSGSVVYSGVAGVSLGAANTYSGSTLIENETVVISSDTDNNHDPAGMFGSSSISIDAGSSVRLRFDSNGVFANDVTLSATTYTTGSGSTMTTFNAQLYIQGNSTNNVEVALSSITLAGAGGIGFDGGVNLVDLAGIQANDHCLYVPTIDQDTVINGPAFCDPGGDSGDDGDDGDDGTDDDADSTGGSGVDQDPQKKVPGVPNTGIEGNGKSGSLVFSAIAAALVIPSAVLLYKKYQLSR